MQQNSFLEQYKPVAEHHLQTVSQDGVEIRFIDNAYCLFADGFNWMNTNNIDILDHKSILEFRGNVLCTGLGLGVCVAYAFANPLISHIDVIENDPRIIAIIEPMLRKCFQFPEDYLKIIQADADSYEDLDYDCAFLDHYSAAIPDSVKRRYEQKIPNVVYWYDEGLKWLNTL